LATIFQEAIMQSPDEIEDSDPDILAARGKVELAKAELENRLYQAGDTGKRALARMAGKAKPVAIVAAAIVGVVVIARLVRSRSRRRAAWRPPADVRGAQPLYRVVLGAAVRGALRVLAARMAEQAAARLIAASEERKLGDAEALEAESAALEVAEASNGVAR
jgi:hypothetical protein